MAAFGLSPSELQQAIGARQYEREHDELGHAESENWGTEAWMEKARYAQEVACGLATFSDAELQDKATYALVRAALFALHGGDPAFAEELLAKAPRDDLPADLAALMAVVQASKTIDVQPDNAVAQARAAAQLAEALARTRHGVTLLAAVVVSR